MYDDFEVLALLNPCGNKIFIEIFIVGSPWLSIFIGNIGHIILGSLAANNLLFLK